MAKQKIVLEIRMPCEKYRTIAKVTIARAKGVTSLAIEGDGRVVVVGDEVDIATLVILLRSKLPKKCVHILSIEEVKPVDPEKEEEAKKKKEEEQKREEEKRKEEEYKKNYMAWHGYPYCYYNYPPYPPPTWL